MKKEKPLSDENLCAHCSKPVRKYAADYQYGNGEVWARKGTWDRSHSINAMDPEGIFCTLRCAADYGVRAARQLRRNK